MKKTLLTILSVLLYLGLNAQTETFKLEDSGIVEPGGNYNDGTIVLTQDVKLKKIVKRHIEINDNKFDGWRVQIYFGSGQQAMSAAQNTKKKFLMRYGNKNGAYIVYDSPFFKVRVGDFRTKAEAMYFKTQIEKTFPQSWVIRDRVFYPVENAE